MKLVNELSKKLGEATNPYEEGLLKELSDINIRKIVNIAKTSKNKEYIKKVDKIAGLIGDLVGRIEFDMEGK
ncbi:hypothetical protein KAR91_85980 [Candidatus Pacearchaeota archaeon]|nr:hypothetical protein [Candidatus Pacearchaeota archaeon]